MPHDGLRRFPATLMSGNARLAAYLALALLAGCAPYHGKPRDFVGKWKVTRDCGVERLELRPDWTYLQSIRLRDGRTGTHAGRWSVERDRLTLEDAFDWCGPFGNKTRDEPKARDIEYRTVWEYGQVILEFNPDLDGFRRER